MSESNDYATAESLFGSPNKRTFTDVEIDGLGKFRLRDLDAREAAEYESEKFNKRGELSRNALITANARIITMCCVDVDGNPIFSREDVYKIQLLPAGQVADLAQACIAHSKMDDGEEAAKN